MKDRCGWGKVFTDIQVLEYELDCDPLGWRASAMKENAGFSW